MFTRSSAGANTFVCAFNNILVFVWCPQLCILCCYLFFLNIYPISPNRSRSVQRFSKPYKTSTNCTQIDTNTCHIHTPPPQSALEECLPIGDKITIGWLVGRSVGRLVGWVIGWLLGDQLVGWNSFCLDYPFRGKIINLAI